jgi:LPPG:FO 2-phospho-L-lactate transferase
MYTLAGLSPEDRGWGIEGDTFFTLDEAKRRGLEDWFQLGDRDLVTHLTRTASIARGESLTDLTASLCRSLGVDRAILPMADAPRPTTVVTRNGAELPFQQWLVRARAEPEVAAIQYGGLNEPTPEVLDALRAAELVVICPSNPYVSVEPILTLNGVREALQRTKTIAVSPILNGKAVKGPLASMIRHLTGRDPSAAAVVECYEGLLDGYVVHHGDVFQAPFPVFETNILIQSREDRVVFAKELLELAGSLG